ncbi:hypothetical protein AKG95_11340 [Janthinobacterium lividum]|uniref:Uncharacterized protein n=1 Tax=Janthinobacterium lividum TaxID=29581 RepID=A0A1S1UBR5_9BURK|nr:hypothetical protein [Janthinobacterium lividum]OHV97736.1 hypothetical protein AKG95_11340 [Janthinobacterium lividum]
MATSNMQLKQERLDALFEECQQHVFSQIIGPFGLSPAMFADKAGGNVTTVQNFEKGIVATESDKALHDSLTEAYDRSKYELSQKEWAVKRDERIARGVDEYTNEALSAKPELDHFIPIKEVATNAKMHLALGEVKDGKVSVEKIKALVNDDVNLAVTDISINRSKKDHDAKEWSEKASTADAEKSNAERFAIDPDAVAKKHAESKEKFDGETNSAMFKKQGGELLKTGGKQALTMGLRQSLGILLTELVNGLFNEFKIMIKEGFALAENMLADIGERLGRVARSVTKKLPDAFSALFEGGASGFMSNLLTFVINSFVSTGEKLVRVIRDGLLGLFKAFKLIAFPPRHISQSDAAQQGLKILTTVVITSLGVMIEQSAITFMATIPFLKPLADIVAPVLVGIMVGLLSAVVAYQIDRLFDACTNAGDERRLDELIEDSQRMEAFATAMEEQIGFSLANLNNYATSIELYQDIGASFGSASNDANLMRLSLEASNTEMALQIESTTATVAYIESSQLEIERFLKHM